MVLATHTSALHICPGRMCPCCACECHLTDLKILRLKQAQVGRHHVTGAQDHLGAGRRRMVQDGAGWSRACRSFFAPQCINTMRHHDSWRTLTDYSCCSNSIEVQLPLTRRVENLGLRMQLIGRKWNKWIVLRLRVRPLGPLDPGIPGKVEAPGKQRYPLPRLWVRPPELPCRREAPEREQAGWYGQGLVRHWTRWQGV